MTAPPPDLQQQLLMANGRIGALRVALITGLAQLAGQQQRGEAKPPREFLLRVAVELQRTLPEVLAQMEAAGDIALAVGFEREVNSFSFMAERLKEKGEPL